MRRLWCARGLSLASGFLLALSYLQAHLGWLVLVALCPLLLATQGRPARETLLGWSLTGLGYHLLGYFWLPATIAGSVTEGFISTFICCLLLLILESIRFVAIGGMMAALEHRTSRSWCYLPLLWAFVEALWPQLFPLPIAVPLGADSLFGNLAEWGGILLVSLAVVTCNVLAARTVSALVSRRLQHLPFRLYGLLGLLALFCLWSRSRLQTAFPELEPMRVALIQANVNRSDKDLHPELSLSRHQVLTRSIRNKADLIVWSETAVPYEVAASEAREAMRNVIAYGIQKPLLVGTVWTQAGQRFNTLLSAAADGSLVDRYDKRKLVPIFERSLWRLPGQRHQPEFDPGSKARTIEIRTPSASLHALAFICYEGLFPGLVWDNARGDQANLLINISNDERFAHGPAAGVTFEALRWRAVEHRLPMVRVSNSGYSGFIDREGRVRQKTPLLEEAVAVESIRPGSSQTFYARHGNAGLLALCFALLVLPWAAIGWRKLSLIADSAVR